MKTVNAKDTFRKENFVVNSFISVIFFSFSKMITLVSTRTLLQICPVWAGTEPLGKSLSVTQMYPCPNRVATDREPLGRSLSGSISSTRLQPAFGQHCNWVIVNSFSCNLSTFRRCCDRIVLMQHKTSWAIKTRKTTRKLWQWSLNHV